ncbi:MAG: DUF1499 domain-containing protein [Ectothiorhodospiraceae bacterium]
MTNEDPRPGCWGRGLLAVALAFGAVGVLSAALSGPWHRLGLVDLQAAFAMVWVLAVWLGFLAAFLGLSSLVVGLFTGYGRGAMRGAAGAVLLGAAAAAWPMYLIYQSGQVPTIHDITTDTADPPAFRALADAREAAPNAVAYPGEDTAEKQRDAYPEIETLVLDPPREQVFAAAEATAQEMGWRIETADAEGGRLEAVAMTFWYGFKDDVVVRVADTPDGVALDVRSASRKGRSDLGTNAARIRAYLEAVQQRLATD